jgi:hypothetical protein
VGLQPDHGVRGQVPLLPFQKLVLVRARSHGKL